MEKAEEKKKQRKRSKTVRQTDINKKKQEREREKDNYPDRNRRCLTASGLICLLLSKCAKVVSKNADTELNLPSKQTSN